MGVATESSKHTEDLTPPDVHKQNASDNPTMMSRMQPRETSTADSAVSAGDLLQPNVPKRFRRTSHVHTSSSQIETGQAMAPAMDSSATEHATGSAAHPAMAAMPLIENYMKLRASGHHVSEEEEQLVVEAMLSRAAQVDEFESVGMKPLFILLLNGLSHSRSSCPVSFRLSGCLISVLLFHTVS